MVGEAGAVVKQVDLGQITPELAKTLVDLMEAVDRKKPKQQDIDALRRHLIQVSGLWRLIMDLTEVAERQVLTEVTMPRSGTEAMKVGLERVKEELGYSTAPMLERLLIEQVALCWLRQNVMELKLTRATTGTYTLTVGAYWEKRLSPAQSRYLRACETLARVRKLLRLTPLVQVNIAANGGQQVNLIQTPGGDM